MFPDSQHNLRDKKGKSFKGPDFVENQQSQEPGMSQVAQSAISSIAGSVAKSGEQSPISAEAAELTTTIEEVLQRRDCEGEKKTLLEVFATEDSKVVLIDKQGFNTFKKYVEETSFNAFLEHAVEKVGGQDFPYQYVDFDEALKEMIEEEEKEGEYADSVGELIRKLNNRLCDSVVNLERPTFVFIHKNLSSARSYQTHIAEIREKRTSECKIFFIINNTQKQFKEMFGKTDYSVYLSDFNPQQIPEVPQASKSEE